MTKDPIKQFAQWLGEAKKNPSIAEPTAACLATATKDAFPSARMVLLKEFDERGFVFYTNLKSRKGDEIIQNPNVAMCFYWMPLERQVRIEGRVEQVSDEQADAYFATRPRDSRIGAWVSRQSQPLKGRNDLLQAISETMARFDGGDVPRPPFWSGFRVVTNKIEFWQQGDFRLHERELFMRNGDSWAISALYP